MPRIERRGPGQLGVASLRHPLFSVDLSELEVQARIVGRPGHGFFQFGLRLCVQLHPAIETTQRTVHPGVSRSQDLRPLKQRQGLLRLITIGEQNAEVDEGLFTGARKVLLPGERLSIGPDRLIRLIQTLIRHAQVVLDLYGSWHVLEGLEEGIHRIAKTVVGLPNAPEGVPGLAIPGIALERRADPFFGVVVVVEQHVIHGDEAQVQWGRRADPRGAGKGLERLSGLVLVKESDREKVPGLGRVGVGDQVLPQLPVRLGPPTGVESGPGGRQCGIQFRSGRDNRLGNQRKRQGKKEGRSRPKAIKGNQGNSSGGRTF